MFLYYAAYSLLILAVCIKILFDTKTPSKALAYIFLVVSFPIIGAVIYFAIGVNYRKRKLYQKKLKRDLNAFPELEKRVAKYSKGVLNDQKDYLSNYYPLAEFTNQDCLTSNNNKVELLVNGEKKFPEFLQSIREAKHHIHIEYYIYGNDDIGKEVADLLIEKARQGVEVRFIYDDLGSKSIRNKFAKRLRDAGVEAIPFYKINMIYFASRINYRNHRKILVVDGLVGYVGGINVADEYINNGKKELFWRDTHLKIEGTAVLNLQHTFLTDWNFCAKQSVQFSTDYFPNRRDQHFGNQLVQVSASGPDSDHPSIMYNLVQAVLLSRKELLITTPYFIPEKSFLDALKIARISGVDIKILVPQKGDSIFVNTACKSYYQELLDVGIDIYLYKKGFVHAKTMVCDEFVSVVGTANLDNRSFDLNFEVNAIVYDTQLAKELKLQFEKDLEDAVKINPDEWKARPLTARVSEQVMQLFSPLM